MELANAEPTKQLFLYMLTRDISFDYAVLDLIDNSIDSLMRRLNVGVIENELSEAILENGNPEQQISKHYIDITISPECFSITDNCGGIEYRDAVERIFRFGRIGAEGSSLSVFGIGLKRAVFKLGKGIDITSKTESSGWSVKFNVDNWVHEDPNRDDHRSLGWNFPIEDQPACRSHEEPGTTIRVTELNDQVKNLLKNGSLDSSVASLVDRISRTYSLFAHFLTIRVNQKEVPGRAIPIGTSEEVSPSIDGFQEDDVKVKILVSIADKENRKFGNSGWYILCNGRMVLSADTTEATGWGAGIPKFVPKYRPFIGVVFFFSNNPESLPWTTTKDGINKESLVYQLALGRMTEAAKPVISFLNKMYPTDEPVESPAERELADTVHTSDIGQLFHETEPRTFEVARKQSPKPQTVSVQFNVKISDIERARRAMGKPKASARKIAEHAFKYFLKNEATE